MEFENSELAEREEVPENVRSFLKRFEGCEEDDSTILFVLRWLCLKVGN